MNNTKFLKIVVVILLVLNIGTLSFIWIHHHHGMHPPHDRGNAAEFLTHELKLTESQQKQFEQLKEEHHEQARSLHERMRDSHEYFFDLLSSSDTNLINHAADSVAQNQKEMEMITFNHFKKLREICTPEQQKKFDEVVQEALRMMAQQGPHEPHGK